MLNPEKPSYLMREAEGREVSPDDWAEVFKVLGRFGIDAIAINPTEAEYQLTGSSNVEEGVIPYGVDDIHSREQYLANEHLVEFWPEYRNNATSTVNKQGSLAWGINVLAHPVRRGHKLRAPEIERARYAQELGFKVVTPRSLKGFPDQYVGTSYGVWGPKSGMSIIEVGSFIDSIPRLAELHAEKRPRGVTTSVVNFLVALSIKLDSQIRNSEQGTNS